MRNWNKFWEFFPQQAGSKEYLKQVGNTINKKPISDRQFQLIVSGICEHLDLQSDDVVLDLGCGNGLITKELAKTCREVVGVDFPKTLLEVANRDHRPANVTYLHMNVLDVGSMPQVASAPFDKVLMYGVLQYLRRRDLTTLLRSILQVCSKERVMLFASIPDRKRIWGFYNTPKRRLDYFRRKALGNEAIGTWWDQGFVRRACEQLGLECEFHELNSELHAALYRFDVTVF